MQIAVDDDWRAPPALRLLAGVDLGRLERDKERIGSRIAHDWRSSA
jgi:hypothetical protein